MGGVWFWGIVSTGVSFGVRPQRREFGVGRIFLPYIYMYRELPLRWTTYCDFTHLVADCDKADGKSGEIHAPSLSFDVVVLSIVARRAVGDDFTVRIVIGYG